MDDWSRLIDSARQAALRAYAPYSHFRVGASVRLSDGQILVGCNVENASYGLTVCAERNALFSAVVHSNEKPVQLAVICLDADPTRLAESQLRMPCGPCRQVMHELMGPDGEVLVEGAGVWKVRELLPLAFELTTIQSTEK